MRSAFSARSTRSATICASSRYPIAARANRCRSSGCRTAVRRCARARGSEADDRTMRTTADMRGFIRAACAMLARQRDLAGFEVYASSSEHRVARINYTSDIPARGVEEFKSLNADGFAVRIVMARDPHETGNAAIAGDLTIDAVRE